MKKYFLALLMGLSTLFMACEKELPPKDDLSSIKLNSRSANNLNVELTSASGIISSYQATRVEVSYSNSSVFTTTIDFADSSSYTKDAVLLTVLPMGGYELELEIDEVILSNLEDLYLSNCNPAVCYSSTSTSSGLASNFIIEDMVEGI